MQITTENSKNQTIIITVEVTESDYIDNVNKVLEDYRKKAQIPGFRKGKTPMGIIKKQYKKPVLIDEINKLIQEELYKHISTQKIETLGSPLPIENNIDWDNSQDFIFKYEVGIAPKMEVNITQKDKLDYYKIKVENKIVDDYCNDIAKRYGKMSSVTKSIDGDLIFCTIEQLDSSGNILKNGISNEATVSMDYIKDDKIKKMFLGLKVSDDIILNIKTAFSNISDLSAMLAVDQNTVKNLDSDEFKFTVKNINRLQPADLNVELFDKVYGKGEVKTKKEFQQKVKDEAQLQFDSESNRMLKNDVVNYLMKKFDFELPNDYLKNWLTKTSDKKITMEQIEKEYEMYSKSLKWQLIENNILKKYDIKVAENEVIDYAKKMIKLQMMQYGQPEGDDKQLLEIANNVLKNEKEKKKIYDHLYDEKTLSVYKEQFKLKEKSITYDDFVKLAKEKN
tara:strand:+ start:12594 stop:13946 length:1353 start_codon:yes stop_codon:yes gene_type:complete